MPFDNKHTSSDIAPADFSAMNVGIGSQFAYNKKSTSQHQHVESAICVSDEAEIHPQYTMQDYEQYPAGYSSSALYLSKSPAVTVSRIGSQLSYRADHNPCTLIGPQSKMASQELNGSVVQDHSLGPAVRYLQGPNFDDMQEYGIAAVSSCGAESRFGEEPAVAYGYVADVNYRIPSSSINTNTYSPKALLYDNNLNGSEAVIIPDTNSRSLNEHDIQNKMSQMEINAIDLVSQLREVKDDLLDGSSSDICSTLRWRDPNLSEVISFLNNPNNTIKANAAAYLQHLCYMDDPNKQRTRTLGGIPPLVRLLSYDVPEIHKNACGALRNLSYGRQNDENKRAIKNAGGITALVNLLCRTQESEVKELVTGVLWNMSSCEDIKRSIIDESLMVVVNNVIKPHSGWDPVCPGETCYSTVFRNSSGVLRNVSSAGEYARTSLRDSEHLVDCLLYVLRTSIEKNNIGNKTVENCVCILRNLSYRCQEVEDPNYDRQPTIIQCRVLSPSSRGENLGCFGTSKKKKDITQNEQLRDFSVSSESTVSRNKSYEKLWQPEVVQYYLALLQSCSNPETLEAAAGAIQNLSACYWQPSIDIRATVRKEKGLPILVELLRMEVDRVVCAVATALRNLAIDQRNKELIGKYAMRDLVQKLPSGNPQHDQSTSDDTISAVLATVNEVIKKNPEFSRSLLDAGGIDRLMNITRQRQKYTSCVLRFASQVLLTMWQHQDLRDVYKKNGWKEQDFITKSFPSHNPAPNSPNNANNTLNRPMASQGRTRYEDRTIQRVPNNTLKSKETGGHSICNKSSTLCQMIDGVSINGEPEETYQRDTQNAALYIPIVENVLNHSN